MREGSSEEGRVVVEMGEGVVVGVVVVFVGVEEIGEEEGGGC